MGEPAVLQDPAILIPALAADGSRFPIEKMEAHRRGVRHLAVSVFVFSGDALLIQRRAAGKYHSPEVWANSCCSHPHWGETLDEAAHRRLREELGVSLPLERTAVIDYEADVGGGLRECERVHVYRGVADHRGLAVAPDPEEVAEVRWAAPAALRLAVRAQPEDFAPWFRIYLERWRELGF
jgi:isopentenyl-diphosphate delta-isomerase